MRGGYRRDMHEQERSLVHWGNASFDSVEDGGGPGLVS